MKFSLCENNIFARRRRLDETRFKQMVHLVFHPRTPLLTHPPEQILCQTPLELSSNQVMHKQLFSMRRQRDYKKKEESSFMPATGIFSGQDSREGTIVIEVHDDGNVDLALPNLDVISNDSDTDGAESSGDDYEETYPLTQTGLLVRQKSSGNQKVSHSFTNWLANMNDTICGKDGFHSHSASAGANDKGSFFGFCDPKFNVWSAGCIGDGLVMSPDRMPPSFSKAYSQGIYSFLPNEKKTKSYLHHTPQEFLYISKQEQFYASRWKGHLPLVPMSASEVAIKRKTRLRKRALNARGLRPSTPPTDVTTGVTYLA